MTFNLREARHNGGLSLAALAAEIGVSKGTLARAESGATVPRLPACLAIAEYWARKGYTGPDGEALRVTDIWPVSPIDQETAAA